ncbi:MULTISPECIES: hypothetical protein [Enterobacter]|uniref:Uncharacterized protein n=1 Tax=Enterobacter intestinihominis TaxID=3133180 RepID=A0ABV1ZE05_9ENTR|nr:hypothetical protein [Enterobacter hormaechei]QLT99119.1 hypothetical protein HV163_08965 [Enterobacter hormaechei]SAB78732.1 Uncharacterised protein [Enterobacter hormaechei]SAF51791.1 Uncharacterised protein [Enterobacter hormaechei]VAK53902.1 Uncharacterised protein [Enterobacter hormaechei]VAK94355.1 Uncharacterised protein [Enterobacter hormaechei]
MIIFLPEMGIRTYIDEQLEQFGFPYDGDLTTNENLKAVFALQRRIPSAKRRIVIELPGIQVPKETEKAYDSIRRKLTLGLSIKPHLSLSTSKYIYNDLLLNCWNIHHLHLSEESYKKGYFRRTGPVLFCMFFDNAVVLIDIMYHGSGHSDVWVNEKLIKKLHKYLPESIERYKVKGITGHDLDSKQRLALQKSHCNYSLKMEDGTVYQLMGIMSNGDCFHDIHRLMHVQRNIDYFTKVIELNEHSISTSLESNPSEKISLTISLHGNQVKLYAIEKRAILELSMP